MEPYKLNEAAEMDIEQLFEYGIDQFGLTAALEYLDGLKQRFNTLAINPLLYPAVQHIRMGYRRSTYGSHAIYYRIHHDSVEIMRILGAQNVDNAFNDLGNDQT